jgi:hypothetical protein
MHTHMCLETHEMRDVKFFLRHNIYCDACVFFFWGTVSCIYCPFFFWGCVATYAFFFFFLWDIYFENHELGLGLALLRLGIRVGPAMKKEFDLSWKSF